MDISSEGVDDIGIEQLQLITRHKSKLLVECTTVIRAIFGGAGKDEVERLRKYARSFGLMGQEVDKILDWEKGQAAGKATYPKILGMEEAKEMAERLNIEAKEQLAGFDLVKAAPLIALANYIHPLLTHSNDFIKLSVVMGQTLEETII